MKNKRFIGLILALAVVAMFILPHFLMADDPFCSRPHSWTAKQWFKKAVRIFGDTDFTSTADVDFACDVDFNNGLYANDEFVIQSYDHASTTGALTWLASYGNTLYTSGTTGITVTLPAITSAMDGYRLTVKNTSGSAARTMTPANSDLIESIPGTITGTSCPKIAYPGDFRTWEADFATSATSGHWKLIESHCCTDSSFKRRYAHASTSGALTWSPYHGNTVHLSGTTGIAVTLPAGSAALEGYQLTFKNTSGSAARTITPNNNSLIESQAGTMSGTADASIAYPGDWRTWELDFVSGGSSVWYLVDSHCFVKGEADRTGSAFTTAASWSIAMGNIVQCTNAADGALTLPAITVYMDGLVFTFKRTSGSTEVILTPSSSNAIEATQGTLTGTSDTSLDAAGDVGVYMPIHSSKITGSSSVWVLILEDIA